MTLLIIILQLQKQRVMENSLKVSFYLKKNETDSHGTAPIMGRIRVGKTEAPFSTKAKIRLSLWDTRSGRALGKSKEATLLNQKLDTINVVINARYRELSDLIENVTAELLKAAFQGIVSNQATLIEYFENHITEYEKRIGKDREAVTMREIKNSLKHVKKFLKKKYNLTDIPFSSLTYSFIENYDYHLRVNLHLSSGSILGLISRLRRMVKYAINEGFISVDPFSGYKPIYPKAKQKYLTMTELESIINTVFSADILNNTRDMFLFSCFTGLAYTDIRNLTTENIIKAPDGIQWIRTHRQKTGVQSNIPLLELPIQIIDKYSRSSKNGKLLPIYSNSVINKQIKQIAKSCGIDRNLTFHCGRHTYASTVTLSQGIPIESVSSMLGHKNLSTTNIYAKITVEKIGKDIEELDMRINNRYKLTQLDAIS
jgi:site-specific recombinase XerD